MGGATVVVGAATDPYQPAEGRYRLTRACLEVFAAAANPFSIITRGPMIVRDVDVLREAARRADVSVTFSIPTLDEDVWRRTEPSTAHPRQRLRALRGSSTRASMRASEWRRSCPGLSTVPSSSSDVVRAAREAGATGIWANLLFLKPGRASTSSRASRATGPSSCRDTSAVRERSRVSPEGGDEPVRAEVARLARAHGVRDRRHVRLAPPPEPSSSR